MNYRFLILFALVCVAFAREAEAAPEFAPSTPEINRYEHIWKRSPFSAQVEEAPNVGGLAKRFVLTGIATMNEKPVVFLLDRQTLSRVVIQSGETNRQNIEIVSVKSERDPRKSSVVIRVGAERASIGYDPASLQAVNQTPPTDNPGTAVSGNNPTHPAPGNPLAAGPAQSPAQASAGEPPTPKITIRRKVINLP